jgi:uncharacterized damage-inducible protein DinB
MKVFMLALAITLSAISASPIIIEGSQGAQAGASGFTAPVRNSWNRVQRLVVASAEAMPDANYAFKPTPNVRSFGELIGHLANEHYMICSSAKGEMNPRDTVDYEKTTAKADLVKALKESNAYCDAAYAISDEAKLTSPTAPNRRDTPFSGLVLNVTHDSEHYGNIVTYLRLKNIVPPSSQPSR